MSTHWHQYPNEADWAVAVSNAVLAPLRDLADNAQASVILTGGATPGPIYARMAEAQLPWSGLTLLLSDDRQVPVDHEHSNLRLLRRHFGSRGAQIPELDEAHAQAALPAVTGLLGMGPDGHVLSWFSGAEGFAEILTTEHMTQTIDAANSAIAGPITRRISLSLAAVRRCPVWHVAIRGPEKRQVAEAAVSGQRFPISELLSQSGLNIHFHWCA